MSEQNKPVVDPKSQFVCYPEGELEDLVVDDAIRRFCNDRLNVGEKHYGVRLCTHNGRDAVRDAKEELADGVLYLTQAMMEAEDEKKTELAWSLRFARLMVLFALEDLHRDVGGKNND